MKTVVLLLLTISALAAEPGVVPAAQLAEIAKAMQAAGTEKFLVEGHTCDLGGDAHNLSLSQRRALVVRGELVKAGVPGERLQVIGFGESALR